MSDSATPWVLTCQTSLSMGFPRQEYWSGSPCPPPGESSWPRDRTWVSFIAGRSFTVWATREVPRKIFFKEWKKNWEREKCLVIKKKKEENCLWSRSRQTVFWKLSRPSGRWEVVAPVTAVMLIFSCWGQRRDPWLQVGKTDTVCFHPNFSLIYFDHFLLWPSTRCTS